MVTKTQIDRLSQRIDLVAEQLGLAQRAEYVVCLDFGEPDKEILARYTDARGPDGRRRSRRSSCRLTAVRRRFGIRNRRARGVGVSKAVGSVGVPPRGD